MESNKVDDLVKELQLSKTGTGWTVAGAENKKDVEIIVRRFLSQMEAENSRLLMEFKAKLEVYEKVISISNFSPMLDKKEVGFKNGKTYSRMELEQLQTKIHKITGDGEVMMLFNELLGINAG